VTSEIAKKWKLRDTRREKLAEGKRKSTSIRVSTLAMEKEHHSCLSTSIQTSETEDTEGHECEEDMSRIPVAIRPGHGGFRPDVPVSMCGRAVGRGDLSPRLYRTPQSFSPYTWGQPPPKSKVGGNPGPPDYGKKAVNYGGPGRTPSTPHTAHSQVTTLTRCAQDIKGLFWFGDRGAVG
jgi:hypothetical protein